MAQPDFYSTLEQPEQNTQSNDFYATLQPQQPDFYSTLEQPKPTKTEKKQESLVESFQKGISKSVSGEFQQQLFQPNTQEQVASDPGFWNSLVQEAGTITGDLPYMAAGATLGGIIGSPGGPIGAVVGGSFGAMALPAFLKESTRQYKDFQEKGGDLTFGEFLQRADKVANRTLNEGLFGVILGTVKKAIPLLEKTPIGAMFKSKIAKKAAEITAEAGVATAVPAAVEGRLPEGQDFAHALALFLGFNLAHLPSKAREAIERQGRESGFTPEEFAKNFDYEQAERIKKVAEQNIPKSEKNLKEPEKFNTAKGSVYEVGEKTGKTVEEAVSFEKLKGKEDEKTGIGFRAAVIDELYPLQKYVKETEAGAIPISEDPYKMARLFKGWSGKAETFLEHKTFDPETLEWNGKGFKQIIKPVKNDLQGFSKYLVAKRAIELGKQDKETGIDLEDAKSYVKENAKKFESTAKELREYQNRVLDYAEKSGLISPETKQLWQDMNENYVPMQRVFEEPESEYFGKSMQPKRQFYELKGSKRPIIDPLESIIGNTYTIIRASEQNNVLRSLAKFNEKYKGANEFIEAEPEPEQGEVLSFRAYLNAIKDFQQGDTIRYFENGKIKKMKVDKEIGEVLKGGLKQPELDFMAKIINFPTRLVRTGAITLSPGTIAKLATIDQLEAFLYTDIGYIPYFDMARGIFNAVSKSDMYYKWKAAGGDQALAREMSRNFKQRKLKQVAGKFDKNEFFSKEGLLRAVENLWRPLEESTRISVFEKTLKRKGMTPDNLREAALAAREATLDFAKKGAKTKFMTQAVPFFNSTIQGADKFWQELKKNPHLVPKAIASVTIPTLALWYTNKDRKDYQELPEWEKDAYWHFYVGDQHLKMAKPFELGSVFATVPERLAAYADKKNPDDLKQAISSIYETAKPSFVPAIAATFVETFANKKLHTGAPIIPQRLERLNPEDQYTVYTTETAKKLGSIISHIPYIGQTKVASPLEIDHWISAWTGNAGNVFLNATEKSLEKTGVTPEKITPEKELSEYPVIKSFVGSKGYSKQSASISKFYEEYKSLEKMKNSIKLAEKEGREKDLPDAEIIMSRFKRASQILKVFSKINSSIRNIEADQENYTASEKKILIDQLINDEVGVAREFLGKEP